MEDSTATAGSSVFFFDSIGAFPYAYKNLLTIPHLTLYCHTVKKLSCKSRERTFKMKAKVTAVLLLSLFSVVIFAAGCEENSTSNNKRARLVGNQNLELRKQLDAEIKKHQEALAECEARVEKQIQANQQLGDSTLNMLQGFAEKDKKIEELTLENQQLKEKIKELELKLSSSQ